MKRIFSLLGLLILISLLTGALTAAAPLPAPPTITLVQGLPDTMTVGEIQTVIVHVDSPDQPFLFAAMLPTFHFPGRGLMATNMGGDRVSNGTSADLEIHFIAKNSSAGLPDEGVCPGGAGFAAVAVVAGVRYPGGVVFAQRFPEAGFFCVKVVEP